MKTQYLISALLLILFGSIVASGESASPRTNLLGEAILNDKGYPFLEHLSTRFGPRMVGTASHGASLDYLEKTLQDAGIETFRQPFRFPGWVRGDARVELLGPLQRELRAAALGYVGTFGPVEGGVAFVEATDIGEFAPEAIRDRVLLVRQNVTYSLKDMVTLNTEYGVKGLLYINRVNGGQLLARTANRTGEATPFPVFTISQEEGLWMKGMLEDGQSVRVRMETTSRRETFTGQNLVARLPGRSGERIILGGHFDSWDLGQGSMDNGLGVAQIREVARMMKKLSPVNQHTIDFVWFDAEEFGLWGSRHYADATDLSDVRVMVNLDMVGRPIAINAMGFDSLVPELEAYAESLGAWAFSKKVANVPWLGSDHHPFIMKGVPAITFNAPIDHDDVRYYHDFADTMDKVDRLMLGESTGLIAVLIYDLANSEEPSPGHLSEAETAELFRKAGLEERLAKADRWPFADEE